MIEEGTDELENMIVPISHQLMLNQKIDMVDLKWKGEEKKDVSRPPSPDELTLQDT